jgi:hypothetical protein
VAADALRHAAEPSAPQVPQQRRLPDQPNREAGRLGSSQGRQQRQLRERLQRQVLRLIDEEGHWAPLLRLMPEALVQLGQHGAKRVHLHRDLETAGQQDEELPEGETRLPEHHRRTRRRGETRQIRVYHCRFADPRGARDDHKALAGGDASRQGV